MSAPSSSGSRWVPALLGLAIGLVAVESTLRLVGAVWLEDRSAPSSTSEAAGLSIVCLGDSNTYGIYEPERASYPGQLQALLAERASAVGSHVVNLGIPATTSEQLLERLPRALEDYAPDVVLALVGINDRWSVADRGGSGAWTRPAWQELRIVKLVQIVAQRASGTKLSPANGMTSSADDDGRIVRTGRDREGHEYSFWERGEAEFHDASFAEERLRANLAQARLLCRDAGAELMLLTYGWGERDLGETNESVRRCAAELGLPLIDCERGLAPALEVFGAEALFYPDRHPKALGYRLIARLVYAALVEHGRVPAGAQDPPELLEGVEASGGTLALARRHGEVGVLVSGAEPNQRVQVLLSFDGPGPRVQWQQTRTELVDDDLFRASQTSQELGATVNSNGEAFVSLAPVVKLLRDRPDVGQGIRALYIVPGHVIGAIAHVSNLVEIPRRDLVPNE